MTATVQKCNLAELLAFSNAEFDQQIKEMSLKDLLDTISTLQKEMSKEQENFNSLRGELSTLSKNSRQYKQISKEMTESQNRLTALMDRSMKCFQQQGSQSTATKFPNVQRRNSLKENNSGKGDQSNSKPVQRNMSARIPKKEGEVTPVLMNKTNTKSTPNLVTSMNQPVFLKPLTDVNTTKTAVKKPANSTSAGMKPMQIFNEKPVRGDQKVLSNGLETKSNENKKESVKSYATFNLKKSKSSEFLPNGPSQHTNGDLKKISDSGKGTTNFNVVLRKTNRNLIDNEEQENNFRHSVDMDSREYSNMSGKTVPNPSHKTNIDVSSPQQKVFLQKTNFNQNKNQQNGTNFNPVEQKPNRQIESTKTIKEEVKKQIETTKTVRQEPNKHVETKKTVLEEPKKQVEITKTSQDEPTNQKVKSTVQFRPTTAAEARAVTGGKRQNLLEEIQNFKRKPNEEAKTEQESVQLSKNSDQPDIVKSSIKKEDVIDDLSPVEANDLLDGDEEIAPHRINLINWDPTKLLKVLYTVKLNKDTTEDISHQYVNMEGLMEKLPMNKKKATLLKTWKRRFFRAKDGWLHYYETSNREKPSDSVQLMGGKIEDLGSRVLGIDDGRGRFLMVRCPTEKEYGQWKLALESQTVSNVTYVRPALSSPQHPEKKVIIIDIGSGGIRAGVMGAQPCLPQMFFPSVVARNKTTKELVIGTDAYKPEIRKESVLVKLVEPSNKVDKDHVRPFAIDMDIMTAVLDYIFKGLNVDPVKHWIMLSTPYKLGDSPMGNLMEILTDKFHTKGVCMVMQSLLALYSYNTTSGIMVDIGERMEILPIFDGVLIEGGVSRQAYGGQKVVDSLKSSLTQLDYHFLTPVDKLLVRYVMEQSCYVCDNYKEEKSKCDRDPESYQTTIYLNNFDLPEDAHMSVTHDLSCFNSTEGFFNADLWGMDYPCVHKLVYNAIQSCPMDNRKHMYRAIYLSGGVTMLPGFAERLEKELKKLAPPSVLIEVHCSPQRYHSAFIGAGTLLSNVQINEQVFISADEWKRDGAKAFRKWKGPS